MKTINKAAILLLTIVMTGASQVALADVETCSEIINNRVIVAINSATYYGKLTLGGQYKDQENMVLKAKYAILKLDVGKFEDAADKLWDISEKANALEDAKPKPKLDGAGEIDSAISEAVDCINGLSK